MTSLAVSPLTQAQCARVNLLGGFALFHADGSPVQLTGSRARGILACLLLAPDRKASRERLCELFWGDRGEAQARSSLRQSLFELKAALDAAGSDALQSDRDAIRLDKDHISSDVYDLAALLKLNDPGRLATALASISDLFFDDLGIGGSYQDWRNQETARLERALATSVHSHLEALAANRDWAQASALAEAWLARDPLDEGAVAIALRADRATGANAAAQRRYLAYKGLLARELAIDPGPLVQAAMSEEAAMTLARSDPTPSRQSPSSFTQPPFPPGLQIALTPLFGRANDLHAIGDAWQAAKQGITGTVLLGGEPGIGKTSLAAEVSLRAHAEGAIVLFGACDEDVRLSYRPFAEALRHYVAHASTAALQRHADTYSGVLAPLIPELRERVPRTSDDQRSVDNDVDRFRLFEAVVGLLAGAADEAPVVLVLDDLQWAGGSDLQLFKHLVRAATSLRLLIIATFRESDIDSSHALTPVLADLRRASTVRRLAVAGLEEAAIAEFVAAEISGEDPVRLARSLHRETAGNPFFLREIVQHWSELASDPGAPPAENMQVPDGVREIIERRLGRLSPQTVRLLGIAAVAGQQFDLSIVGAIAGKDVGEDDLFDAFEEASRAALVSEVADRRDCFRFSHAIVRTTLYEGQSAARRRRLHRRIGEALEARAGGRPHTLVDALAHHWSSGADADDVPKAVDYLARAGAQASAALAYEAAATHYRKAVALLDAFQFDERATRCDLLLARGAAERSAGDPHFRATMAEAADHARHIGDAVLLARAALGSGNLYGLQWGNEVEADLVSRYEEALGKLDNRDVALRVRLMSQLAVELRYSPDVARCDALTREAIELARTLNDGPTLARVLVSRVRVIESPFSLDERLQLTHELEEIAASTGNLAVAAQVASLRFDALLQYGDVVGAEAALVRSERAAAQLHAPFFAVFPQSLHTLLAIMRGDPVAPRLAHEGFTAMSAIGLAHAPNIYAGCLFEFAARRGELAKSVEQVRGAATMFPAVTSFRTALVYTLAETGAHDEARALLSAFADEGFAMRHDLNWASALHYLSEASFAVGDPRLAQAIYPDVVQVADQVGMSVGIKTEGALAHSAGLLAFLLGRTDDAAAHMENAITLNDRIGAIPAAVTSRRAYATMLIANGAPAKANPLINQALAQAEPLELIAERAKLTKLADQLSSTTARSRVRSAAIR